MLHENKQRADFAGKSIFRGANLFPFPNRIRDGRYRFAGREYQLELNYPEENNASHGLVFNKSFTVSAHETDKDQAVVSLTWSGGGDFAGYPFPFEFSITCSLSLDGFTCTRRVKNTGNEPMPMGDGWHPVFTLGKRINELQLRLRSSVLFPTDKRMIPGGDRTPYRNFNQFTALGETEFDTVFELTGSEDKRHRCLLYDPGRDLSLELWQEAGTDQYDYLQIYTPPDRRSIALEPMTCIANAFNNRIGLIELGAGRQWQSCFGVRLKPGKPE